MATPMCSVDKENTHLPAGRWCRGKGRQVPQPATDGDRQLAPPSRSQAGLEPSPALTQRDSTRPEGTVDSARIAAVLYGRGRQRNHRPRRADQADLAHATIDADHGEAAAFRSVGVIAHAVEDVACNLSKERRVRGCHLPATKPKDRQAAQNWIWPSPNS